MAFKDHAIRYQILLFVGMISGIALVLVVGVSIGLFVGIGDTTKNLVQTTLEQQAQNNLLQASQALADVINRKLLKYEEAVKVIVKATQQLLQKPNPLGPRVTYFWYDTSTAPPDTHYDADFGYNISLTASVFMVHNSNLSNIDSYLAQPDINQTVTLSATLDSFFPPFLADREISQLEVGFQSNKVYRRFPGTDIFIARNYDPTIRPWYIAGVDVPNTPAYSTPYLGAATKQWTISVSLSIPTADDLGIFGVVAAEIRLKTIQNLISGQTPLGVGYASLITFDGTIISDPSWNPADTTTLNLQNVSTLYSQLQTPFTTPAYSTVTLNGSPYVVAQVPLHGQFLLLYVVPQGAVLKTVVSITNNIDSTSNQLIGITVGVGLATLLVVLLVSTFITFQITKPVQILSRIALQIASNAANANKMENVAFNEKFNQQDEIGDLTRAFTSMLKNLTGGSKAAVRPIGEVEMTDITK